MGNFLEISTGVHEGIEHFVKGVKFLGIIGDFLLADEEVEIDGVEKLSLEQVDVVLVDAAHLGIVPVGEVVVLRIFAGYHNCTN